MLERHPSRKGLFFLIPMSSSWETPAVCAVSPSVLPSYDGMSGSSNVFEGVWLFHPPGSCSGGSFSVLSPAVCRCQQHLTAISFPQDPHEILKQHASGKTLYKQHSLVSYRVDFRKIPGDAFPESSTSGSTKRLSLPFSEPSPTGC